MKFIKIDLSLVYVIPEEYFAHAIDLDTQMMGRIKELYEAWNGDEENPRELIDCSLNIISGDEV